jgi:hypothetical protein
LPEIDFRFPGSDISAMAYIGALAPDITTYQRGHFREKVSDENKRFDLRNAGNQDNYRRWATLLHTHRSGDVLLTLLEHVAGIPSPALRSQALAFAMGYLSHIATDIALNPCINTLAASYRHSDLPWTALPLGAHFYAELCLDEYIAATYFKHDLYTWANQPWVHYIEPAARTLLQKTAFSTRIFDLLANAVEETYALTERQKETFRSDALEGLRRLRLYLAGRGSFRWFALNARMRRHLNDPIMTSITVRQRAADEVTFEEVLQYAIQLSERLCRRAISYYASLRNSGAGAAEREQRRTRLRGDLRNWDLDTGYALDVSFDQEVTLHVLHNWIYFGEIWERGGYASPPA